MMGGKMYSMTWKAIGKTEGDNGIYRHNLELGGKRCRVPDLAGLGFI